MKSMVNKTAVVEAKNGFDMLGAEEERMEAVREEEEAAWEEKKKMGVWGAVSDAVKDAPGYPPLPRPSENHTTDAPELKRATANVYDPKRSWGDQDDE